MAKNSNRESPKATLNKSLTSTKNSQCEEDFQQSSLVPQDKPQVDVVGTAVHLLKSDREQSSSSQRESQQQATISKMPRLQPEEKKINLDYLQLQDTTLDEAPLHLIQLLRHCDASTITQAELMLLLINTIALESGYATLDAYLKCSDFLRLMPHTSCYHSKNILCLTSEKPTYSHDDEKLHFSQTLRSLVSIEMDDESVEAKSLHSRLTAIVSGDFMIVTLTPDRRLEIPGCSICLSMGRYVLGSLAKGKPLYQRFRKLDELSFLMREQLFVRVRNQQLKYLGAPIYPSLESLPAELYDQIWKYLSKKQLNAVANVCQSLNYSVKDSKYARKAG